MLHAWTLEYQHMMLCVWWWIPTKAESQWPAGENRPVALATSGSTRFRMPTLYCYLYAVEIRDRQGSWSSATAHSDYVTTTTTIKRQKWKVKLIFRGAYGLSGTGIVECLEIIDVGYNLKQFDGLTRLTLTPRFYDRSTPLVMLHNCALYKYTADNDVNWHWYQQL